MKQRRDKFERVSTKKKKMKQEKSVWNSSKIYTDDLKNDTGVDIFPTNFVYKFMCIQGWIDKAGKESNKYFHFLSTIFNGFRVKTVQLLVALAQLKEIELM